MCLCVHGELTEVLRQLPASVPAHDSLVIHVALVSYQQYLGVVPRVCLNLCRPGTQHTQQRAKLKDTLKDNVHWCLSNIRIILKSATLHDDNFIVWVLK